MNKQDTLKHYTQQAALARATRAAEAAEQVARLAVAEAHAQRRRADALARRVDVLCVALRGV